MTTPPSPVTSAGGLRRDLNETMVALERTIARASGLPDWTDRVEQALDALIKAVDEHIREVEAVDGLLDQIRHEAPRLSAEISELIKEHEGIVAASRRIENELVSAEGSEGAHTQILSPARLRRRITALLGRLTMHRQRGSDLVFEAYNVDIAAGD